MKLYYLLLGILLAGCPTLAQSIKLAGIEFANYPKIAVKDSPTGQQLAFQEVGAYINIPIAVKKSKLVFLNGLRYGQLNATTYNSPIYNQTEAKQPFYTLVYSLNVIKQLSTRWTVIAGVLPTLSSDFTQPVSHNDFLLQGVALARYQVRDGLTLGGGVAYSNRLGKPLGLPVLQVSYQKGAFSVNAVLPVNITAYFQTPNGRFRAGLRTRTAGSYFNIQNEYVAANNFGTLDKLSYTRINVGPSVEWKLVGPLVLELAGGLTTRRHFDFRNTEQDVQSANAQTGPFLSLGLSISPNRPRKVEEGID